MACCLGRRAFELVAGLWVAKRKPSGECYVFDGHPQHVVGARKKVFI